ncbi:MAG: serine/threonine protein kinase [Myxococcales bacterium]|nr:serine/threonine protein kinase [Myxococcales bacterium]
MNPVQPAITVAPEALRPRVEGDFANDRVKQDIMSRLFGDPSPTARIGRFTVVRELGRGGTGVVYAAYDEQLERKIAVKLLHADNPDADARARLLREAQAMARLSHPHIVSVHEVGTHNHQIYIAMEFVHGLTLGTWLKRQPRTWREIVEVFRQAASGLAAAHEAGLVHRDFKPQNAIVGEDGRVRVLDFGLARADGDPELFADLERTRDSRHDLRALDASLTITGSLIGTPAFMAPEQFRGERADPRSDQFALCVALYEALYRERPYAGDTIATLMHSVLAGQVRDPGHSSAGAVRLPRGLRHAILRGLSRRPEDRHPSMDALLTAIDRAVEPRRRPWLAGLALSVGLGAGVGVLALGTGAPGQVCEDRGRDEIAAVWSPARADAIATALRAVDPQADDAWTRAAVRFDAYARAWQQEVVATCSAEQRHEQSAALADLRRACLDERLGALSASLALFDRPEPTLAVRAADIAAGLAPISDCADTRELQRRAPTTPERAALVADLRAELARADALRHAALHDQALAHLDELATRVAKDDPLQAELALSRGRLLAGMGRDQDAYLSLQTAYFSSLAAADDRHAVTAAIDLVQLTSQGLADFMAARRWARHAQALIAAAGTPALRADLASAEGQLSAFTGRHAEAQGHYRRALALYAEAGLADTAAAAVVQRSLADVVAATGDLDQAEAQLADATAILEREYCERHPDRAAALRTAGKLATLRGDLPTAIDRYDRALANLTGVIPEDSGFHLELTADAAKAHLAHGEATRAEAMLRRSLAAADSRERGELRTLHPGVFDIRLQLAELLLARNQLAEAETLTQQLSGEAERAWGTKEPYVALAIDTHAEVLLAAGRPAEALPLAERAHNLAQSRGALVHPKLRYLSAWVLARALAATGDTTRTTTLATDARSLAEQSGDTDTAAAISAWLAEPRTG